MEHLSNDHKDRANPHKNSHKLCYKTGHPIVSLMESQWKLRQQYDQNFPYGGKVIAEQILGSVEINPKEQDYENQSLESE